jgi:tRNA threonylcarbamoyladenosine biosynthesis protein TsaE
MASRDMTGKAGAAQEDSAAASAAEVRLVSLSPEETVRIGEILGAQLEAGDVVALVGELGAGKTCLTQGIAQGLGVPPAYRITSPTFTLINEYPGRLELYHMDMYRLGGAAETADMGMDEYFDGRGVVVVEWAEKIAAILPERTLFIRIAYEDEQRRLFRIAASTEKTMQIVDALHEGGFEAWR